MTSVRTTNSDQGDARSVGTRNGSARLSLKPKGSPRGALDGAWWWPRSLLVPVCTEEVTAELALAMATDGDDPDFAATVGDHSAPVSRPVGPSAEAKAFPDNEDGAPDRQPHDRAVTTHPVSSAADVHPVSSAADVALPSAHRPG